MSKKSPVQEPPTEVRNKFLQPFASTSVWNRPIGTGASYATFASLAAANGGTWQPPSQGYSVDESWISLDPTAPTRNLIDRGYWWPYPQSGNFDVTNHGPIIRVPDNFIIPVPSSGDTPNNMSAMLTPDTSNNYAQEFQYACRPQSASDVTYYHMLRGVWDLHGDGISDGFGSHGGAGLNCLGGTIRGGELTGTDPIPHALAVTINTQKWACKQGGGIVNGYRWPAIAADSNALDSNGGYGDNTINGTPLPDPGVSLAGLGMGTLIAIPASVSVSGLALETAFGTKFAEALQGYGAYVVDTSHDPGGWDTWLWNLDSVANRVDATAISRSYAGGSPGMNGPLARDFNKILLQLAIVTNNNPGGISAGGGTPIRPVAPPLA